MKTFIKVISFIVAFLIATHLSFSQNSEWIIYKTSNSGLPDNWVNTVTIDGEGNKWIGTGGGLVKFDDNAWTVYNTSNSGLPHNSVVAIAIDSSGNKWIGLFNSGLVKYNDTTWTAYNTSNSGLQHNLSGCSVTLWIDSAFWRKRAIKEELVIILWQKKTIAMKKELVGKLIELTLPVLINRFNLYLGKQD